MIRKPQEADMESAALCESLREAGIQPSSEEPWEWQRSPFVIAAALLGAAAAGPIIASMILSAVIQGLSPFQ